MKTRILNEENMYRVTECVERTAGEKKVEVCREGNILTIIIWKEKSIEEVWVLTNHSLAYCSSYAFIKTDCLEVFSNKVEKLRSMLNLESKEPQKDLRKLLYTLIREYVGDIVE